MQNRILVINGIRSDSFGFKINVHDFDNITSSETFSTVSDTGVYKKNKKRKVVKSSYAIDIPNASVQKIDVIKQWLLQENVPFSDYSLDRECIAFKIDITGSERLVKNYYTIEFDVIKSSLYYAKEETTVKNNGRNTLSVKTNGTAETEPRFYFTAPTNLSMFAISHPDGRVFQIGNENENVVISAGQSVVIDMKDGSVIVGGNKRLYATGISDEITLGVGSTSIGFTVNSGATIPLVTMRYKEAYK